MRVRFVHNRPKLFNLGDLVCSPRHYFSFQPADRSITIIGGGAYNDLGFNLVEQQGLCFAKTVVWGIGRSLEWKTESNSQVKHLPFALWGLRDRDITDESRFLPCVSCMHEMLDEPIEGDYTLLYLNRAPRATPPQTVPALKSIAKERGWIVLFNDLSDRAFFDQWKRCSTVITNSYHGAYWSLLSGRSTIIAGYSSKFASLLASVGARGGLLTKYNRGDTHALGDFAGRLRPEDAVHLDDPQGVKSDFREINIAFAQSLVTAGLVGGFEVRRHHLKQSRDYYLIDRTWATLAMRQQQLAGALPRKLSRICSRIAARVSFLSWAFFIISYRLPQTVWDFTADTFASSVVA